MTVTEERVAQSGEDIYVGGLDGLRAIAVAAVIVFHFAPSVLPAGFLGVDVFFVVSGFLISRLVMREIERSGAVSLRNFWARRARRLLPALATVTVAVLCAAAISFSSSEIHDLRAQALGTLFYCVNWVIIFAKGNYFTSLGRPSPLLHLWTLAVEEQFYVALPIVLFGTETRCPSGLRTRVLRMPTDSTNPSAPSTLIWSPTRNGLSANTAIAPKRFAKVSWAARPTANPPMESDVIAAVILIPMFCTVTSTATITINTSKLLRMIENN